MGIDSYSFGRIVIDGRTYTSDVIIYPDRIDSSWWRKEGHLLQTGDIPDVLSSRPDVLIIGTGDMGVMKVHEKTLDVLGSLGIEVHVQKTGIAVAMFNAQPPDKKVIAAFHLTC